ncbi:hypothetical protein QTP70_016151, partial [Hemibagrus guttatus]
MGHQGVKRTLGLLKQPCYWPQKVVAMDFTTLEPALDGRENVLVVTDVFMKFSQAFPTRDQKADTTAKILVKEWFLKWPEYLPELVYAYNVTPHASTGYSPYYMLFGRQPHLPVDALLGQEPVSEKEPTWLTVHRERLQDAHSRAREYTERKAADRVAKHESGVYCPEVAVSQQVYLRYRPLGRNKIQSTWAPTVYQVVEVQGTTYTVEPVGGGPAKRVHRSNIRPCPRSDPVPMPRIRVSPVGVSTPKLMMEMLSLDAECVFVEKASWSEENMMNQALEELWQSNLKPDEHAGTVVEETQENSDDVQRDEEADGVKEFPQPEVGNADIPVNDVRTGPVPVPRKPRAGCAPEDAPRPMPR